MLKKENSLLSEQNSALQRTNEKLMSRILDSEVQLQIQSIDDKQLQENTARILAEVYAFLTRPILTTNKNPNK